MAHIEFDSSYMPCAFAIVADGFDCHDTSYSVLVQTDWDWPGVATNMGWQACNCGGTDGTVDCKNCNRTATEMISEAYEFICEREGEDFDALDDYLELGD